MSRPVLQKRKLPQRSDLLKTMTGKQWIRFLAPGSGRRRREVSGVWAVRPREGGNPDQAPEARMQTSQKELET